MSAAHPTYSLQCIRAACHMSYNYRMHKSLKVHNAPDSPYFTKVPELTCTIFQTA